MEETRKPIHKRKIGRNEPCWCGSSKKYKKCHLNRDANEPSRTVAIYNEVTKKNSVGSCLYPISLEKRCGKKSIDSHSIQKSGPLKAISVDGHVMGLKVDMGSDAAPDNVVRKIGIGKASIFPGFCSDHDKSAFRPVEKKDFNVGEESSFLLAYRTLLLEMVRKEGSLVLAERGKELDNGTSIVEQISIQAFFRKAIAGIESGINSLRDVVSQFDRCLIERDFSQIRHVVLRADGIMPFVVSSAQWPWYDFNGDDLGNMSEEKLEETPDHIIATVLSFEGKTYLSFVWLGDLEKTSKWVNTFLDIEPGDRAGRFLSCACRQFENMFFSPQWWGEASEEDKNYIQAFFEETMVEPIECMLRGIPSLPPFRLEVIADNRASFQS